jgi:general secretion pathway protein D
VTQKKNVQNESVFSILGNVLPVVKPVPIVLIAALFVGSCDGSLRKTGWFIGGKDRRIVDIPKPAKDNTRQNPNSVATTVTEKPARPVSLEPLGPKRLPGGKIADRAPARSGATVSAEIPIDQIKGSGSFISKKGLPKRRQSSPGGGSVTLNFVDADIRDVVKTVLGGTLGQNFAVDPKVKGTITLQTSKPIPRGAVLPTLESALRLNGLALVKSGALYRVMPSNAAARGATRPRLAGMAGSIGEAYGVEILSLEFAAASEMAKIIEPLVPSGAVIRTDTTRNLLIVGGSKHERETIADVVSIFDVDWLSGMSFALVPLKFAQPKQAITDLERVFGAAKGGPLEGLVRFFPVDRRQSVLVISANTDYIERARGWIKRLDVGGEDEKRLYVYTVENGRATDLATILSQVFSDKPISIASSSVTPGQRQARLSTRESSFNRSSSNQNTVSANAFGPPLSAAQAAPAPGRAATRGRSPARTQSRNSVPTASGQPVSPQVEGHLPQDLEARIIPDDVNNALVIMARPATWRMIEDALRKLDVVPLQVMIEATIAEVTLNDDLRYGVQSFFSKGSSTFTLSDTATSAIASTFPGFSYVYDQGNIKAILDALDSVTDIRVVSSPQVLVLDNRTAELQVGDQVPISTQQSISNTDPDAPTVNSVELRDTGVVLRVTPRVNASGVVNLEIDQEESSAVSTTTSGIDSPTIQQRRLRSTVVVNSGETIALGGLIRDTQTDSVSGIPLLSSIPILGNLFGATEETGRRTELLVLITPRVIRNQEEARAVTRELRETLHNAATLKPLKK